MKVINWQFVNLLELEALIEKNHFKESRSLLVQSFDGRNDPHEFDALQHALATLLPHATLLATTTAGEIHDGVMFEQSVSLSFCLFEKTELIPLYAPSCDEEAGKALALSLPLSVKAAIFFTEGLKEEPSMFLKGIDAIRNDLIIAGGAAADYDRFTRTRIALNGEAFEAGVVGVAFDNASLHVFNHWKLNWNPIGKPFLVTKARGNALYELDHTPILEILRYYFGEDVVANLPGSIVKFPLIKTQNGVNIARAPIATSPDGALIFGGEFSEGESVRIGVADIDAIIQNCDNAIYQKPEAYWIYSCMGRKAFAGKILENEFQLYNPLGTTSGFFSYGEFFKTEASAQMLNLTTTIFALSENDVIETLPHPITTTALDDYGQNIALMSRLTNTIVDELEQTIKTLDAYKIALDANSIVSKTNTEGVITYVNDLFVEISGYSKEELIGQMHNLTRHPDMKDETFAQMWATIQTGKVWKGMVINKAKSGKAYYVDTSIVPLFDENKNIVEYIATRNDITEIITQQQRIERQSTDAITQLPNRVRLFEEINTTNEPIIAIFNINNFGEINRFYGFESGDTLLQEFSKELSYYFHAEHYRCYKLESDHFLLLSSALSPEAFSQSVERFIRYIHQQSFLNSAQGINIRITAGLATKHHQILSRAEDALKEARSRGLSWFLSTQMVEELHLHNFQMLHTLKAAIEHERIVPYYQAIVHLPTNTVTKYESLIRLIDEDGVIHLPGEFLDVAKNSKFYPSLTRTMIKKVLHDFMNKKEDVNINLSVEDLEDAETITFIEEAIKAFPEPSRITFELTETEALKDYRIITSFIKTFQNLGVKIAIDDFGSGYSNFAYLAEFNANILKIDGSIIQKIVTDEKAYKVTAAIHDFAKQLGMKTVAEFVYNEATNTIITDLGIDYAQGYFYATPRPIEELSV